MRSLLSLLVEPAMYVAIGFLAAALMSLPLFGVAHRRAERLTRQHLDTLLPMSVKELEAEKDLLRVEHAMAEQRLQSALDDLKAKAAAQQIEIGRHSGTVARLKAELGDRAQAIAALEAREAALKQQLRALEQEHALQSVHLDDARHALRDKEAELARVATDLATRSVIAEQQNVELARTRAEMEALEAAAQDDERERNALNARLARSREEIDAAGRQLADERRKVEDLTQEHAAKSALLDEARAALREQEAELARFATDFATGADIIGQQDLELAKARTEVEALKLESEALRAQLARHGDETDAADRRLAQQRGKADNLDRRAADLEAELIAQREAADALTHITAARVCEQARRLAEQEHEVERLQAALDARAPRRGRPALRADQGRGTPHAGEQGGARREGGAGDPGRPAAARPRAAAIGGRERHARRRRDQRARRAGRDARRAARPDRHARASRPRGDRGAASGRELALPERTVGVDGRSAADYEGCRAFSVPVLN